MLVSVRKSGICNRLRCLITTMRLSDEPAVFWPNNQWVSCKFENLYKPTIKIVHVEPKSKKRDTWKMVCLPTDDLEGKTKVEVEDMLNAVSFKKGHDYQDTENYLNELPDDVKNGYFKQLEKLELKDDIKEAIDKFAEKFDENTVSVSIRSWYDSDVREKLFNVSDFIDVMKTFNKNTKFFVTADRNKVLKQIQKKFGDRVITRKKSTKNGDRESVKGMKDILIDLYLLSKNTIHVGSRYSTYSDFAWWLSHGHQNIIIVGRKR